MLAKTNKETSTNQIFEENLYKKLLLTQAIERFFLDISFIIYVI